MRNLDSFATLFIAVFNYQEDLLQTSNIIFDQKSGSPTKNKEKRFCVNTS
jgi:hypothetical protein